MMSAVGGMALQGCEERWGNVPDLNEHVGAITRVQVNPEKNFFNALNDLRGEEVEFELDVDGFDITEVNSVEVEMIFTEKDATVDAEGNPADSTYTPVLVQTIHTFPVTITITAAEAVEAISTFKPGFTIDSLEVGDGFNLMFPINTADGRRLTMALNSDLCNEPVQPSFGGCNVAWTVACPSDLGGTYDYATEVTAVGAGGNLSACAHPVTGSGTLEDLGGGLYKVSDASFGEYGCAWGDSPAVGVTLVDVCNTISAGGADQYDLVYDFEIISNDGTHLTINWSNSYGDAGTTVLTRTDDKTWPLDLSN